MCKRARPSEGLGYAVLGDEVLHIQACRTMGMWTNHSGVGLRSVEAMRKKKDSSSLSFIFKEALEHAQLLEKWRVQKVKKRV